MAEISKTYFQKPNALLALSNGEFFLGWSIGNHQETTGEVVFNTAMTGYQEVLTDASYTNQIIALTCPHIGNTGTNNDDCETDKIYSKGLIINNCPTIPSSWRSTDTLHNFLSKRKCVGIYGIDTRKLVKILTQHGSLQAHITPYIDTTSNLDTLRVEAINKAKNAPHMNGKDLAKVVGTKKPYNFNERPFSFENGFQFNTKQNLPKVVVYDFGVKRNILRLLVEQDLDLTVVPPQTLAAEVLAMKPDGIFLSNGPGDPEPCDYAIAATRLFLEQKIPLFSICLGYQILAIALGAKTIKMKCGHHGTNHPVKNIITNKVYITSQNHNFMVNNSCLPDTCKVTHVSLFDQSIQGIEAVSSPAFGFQGHPEASPGPQDITELFTQFKQLIFKNIK